MGQDGGCRDRCGFVKTIDLLEGSIFVSFIMLRALVGYSDVAIASAQLHCDVAVFVTSFPFGVTAMVKRSGD